MADEHELGDEADGPQRPSQVRRPTLQIEAPIPGGHQQTDHPPAIPAQARTLDERQSTPADPRFANAPMSAAEMIALYNAPTREAAFALLGQMQETRLKDGRIQQALQPQASSQAYMSLQDIQPGMTPLPQQLAYIQSAPTVEERQARTIAFLETRAAQNEQLFQRSRRWAPEIERLTGTSQDDRIKGPGGIQSWRADAPAGDDRFVAAPLSQSELEGLAAANHPREVARLLGIMQQEREQDGRLAAYAPRRKPALELVVPPDQQVEMGLRPTQNQILRMQAGTEAQEIQLARAFVAERQAANAYWHQRSREWSPQALRDARSELTDGKREGLSRSERAAERRDALIEQYRSSRGDRGQGRGGGRER